LWYDDEVVQIIEGNMQSKSRTKMHRRYASIGITIAVVIMMVLSGPVSAVTIGITGLDGTTTTKGESITFNVTATIENTDKYVPIDNFSLDITGATDKEVVFSTDGDVLSGDSGITVVAVTVPSSTEYGYGAGNGYDSGLGYGYDSGLGYGYDFGYGYGYGYAHGAGGEDVEYKYTITLDTSILNTGAHDAVLSLNTGNSAKPSFESSSASFVIKSPETDTPKTSGGSSGSSGGGGGGGSGATGEAYENIVMKEAKSAYAINGAKVSYQFNEKENNIDFIKFDALKNSGMITVTIEMLNHRSALVETDPAGKVYQNMNIWVGSAGYATPDDIANPVIGFRVERSWMDANDFDGSAIKLNRYHDGTWNPLPTTKVRESKDYIYFEAKTPGFSPFAITGETNSVVSEDEGLTGTDTTTSTEGAEGRTTSYEGENRTKSADAKTSIGNITMLLSFATIIGFMGYIKRDDISKYLKKK
jgi:PGF-pre-PGF domain-containing protein